jgi:DNA invertase Pin-like site-specific DNA recombinase
LQLGAFIGFTCSLMFNTEHDTDICSITVFSKGEQIINKWAYIRTSTWEQANSIEIQTTAAKQAGCSKFYIDEGVSGRTNHTEGKAFKKLLGDLKKLPEGETVEVWTMKLSRFGRNAISSQQQIYNLWEAGHSFTAKETGINEAKGNNFSAKLIISILSAIDEWEREEIAERTRTVLHKLKNDDNRALGKIPVLTTRDIKTINDIAASDSDLSPGAIGKQVLVDGQPISRSTVRRVLLGEYGLSQEEWYERNKDRKNKTQRNAYERSRRASARKTSKATSK